MIITIEIDTDAEIAEVRRGEEDIAEIIDDAEDLYDLVAKRIPRKIAEIYRDSKIEKEG